MGPRALEAATAPAREAAASREPFAGDEDTAETTGSEVRTRFLPALGRVVGAAADAARKSRIRAWLSNTKETSEANQ